MILHTIITPIQPRCPFWQLVEFFADEPCGFLLDSAMDPSKQGRHSFLGCRPSALLTAKRLPPKKPQASTGRPFQIKVQRWISNTGAHPQTPDALACQGQGNPFEALRQLQQEYGLSEGSTRGFPFAGGLVGYLGYETGYASECLPDQGRDDPELPDLAFMVVDELVVHDNLLDKTWLVVTGRGLSLEDATQNARTQTEDLVARLTVDISAQTTSTSPETGASPSPQLQTQFSRETYMDAVQKCREHILAGDVFEVCLTQRLEMDLQREPWSLYQALRRINPAPFSSWLHFPGFQVVSASPERFLKLDGHRNVESRPIKGTRPRGSNPEMDQRLHLELQESEKDRAENLMIVDLVRNDIGKVAEIGSVETPEILTVESYATVFQLVSTVTGKLRPEYDAFDLVQACFPGGSMTGAPKIEAMKIIDGIEPVKRGVYSGAIGYFDRSGTMDLSIVIRTIICKDGRGSFGVGGAVVADSDPAAEYQETLDKAAALIRALGGGK